ncbi:MAG: thiamine-monophosphate kinase, partial [Candidatus Bathyarchaeia archaeon]
GVADEETLMRRDGARPGDILATTGGFGKTAAAFKILLEGYTSTAGLRDSLVESVYVPTARVKEGVALAESGAVSASIDSSDGLAFSLHDLSRSSGVGFRVDRLPTSPEAEEFADLHGLDPGGLVLYGGEEYELVFTVKAEELEVARAALGRVGCRLIEIGEATADKRIVFMKDGVERPIEPLGWEHFKS